MSHKGEHSWQEVQFTQKLTGLRKLYEGEEKEIVQASKDL